MRFGRLAREPLVQFLAGGALIFALYSLREAADSVGEATRGQKTGPSELASLDVDRTIVIGRADLQTLRDNFARGARRAPTTDELGDAIETFVNEEMLYREGKSLGLDREDVVVRRRIIEKMTVLARPAAPSPEPSEAELRTWFARYPHRFRQAPRLSFEQRFFDPKRRPDAAAVAKQVLAGLAARVTRAEALPPQDGFVLPDVMEERSDLQITHLYGPDFLQAVLAAPIGRWSGPHRSSFGEHLVFVRARSPGGALPFEAVEKQVRADWLTVSTRGIRAAGLTLLPRYTVKLEGIEPAQAEALTKAPAVAPLLEQKK
jgi:hypothetical protein